MGNASDAVTLYRPIGPAELALIRPGHPIPDVAIS